MTESPDYDDPIADNNARRDQARHLREDDDTLRRLMGHRNGRAFVYRFLDRCHIHNTPVVPNDPFTSAFNFGREDVGKQLVRQLMRASADLYVKMLAEAQAEEDRLAAVHATEEKQRAAEENDTTQNIDLPPPKGWPGHLSVVPPEGKE